MSSAEHRLAKYARKKRMAFKSGNPRLSDYLILYWRYWHKVYDGHVSLWDA